jgi:hypothetical protein
MRTMEYVEIRNPFAPALAVEHRTACRAKPDCVGEAEEGAVGVDRALETGNSAIYAEYIREMALPKGWALKSPSASRSDRTTKGSMGNVTISSSAEMRIAPRPDTKWLTPAASAHGSAVQALAIPGIGASANPTGLG